MFCSIDAIKESIDLYKSKPKKTNNIYIQNSVLESTLDSLFDTEMENFSIDIKDTLLEEKSNYFNENTYEEVFAPQAEFNALMERNIKDTTTILDELLNKVVKWESANTKRIEFIKSKKDLIDSIDTVIYFPYKRYSYTNFHRSTSDEDIVLKLSKINKYIHTRTDCESDYNEESILFGTIDRKTLVNDLFKYYRAGQEEPTLNSDIEPSVLKAYMQTISSDYYKIEIRDAKDEVDHFKDSLEKFSTFIYSDDMKDVDQTKLRIFLIHIATEINDKIFKKYILEYSAKFDAIMEYIDSIISILIQAINQIEDANMVDYEVPSDKLEDINDKIDLHADLGEVTECMIYNDTVLALESAGLITVNEETSERVQYYFMKISDGMAQVIQKIQDIIRKKINERMNPVLAKLKSPDKPLPAFKINNYKTFDFDKLDNLKPEEFNYTNMKDDLKSRETFIHNHYPELEDTNEKSIYNVMRKKFVVTQTAKDCTPEILNGMIDFLLTDYNKHLEGLGDFRVAIDKAAEQAASIAKQYDQTGEREVQQVVHQQQVQNQEQQATGESTIIEAQDTTSFDDEKQQSNSGQGDTSLMKASTLYCSIMSQILSGRIKMLNFAYNDRLKIVWHYVVKNKFNKNEEEQR